jgi:hypothetical protein
MDHQVANHANYTRRLARKLTAYAVGGASLAAAEARGGIVHTDLGPTGVSIIGVEFEPGLFFLDLNDDGTDDFRLAHNFAVSVSGLYSTSGAGIGALQQNQVFGSYSFDLSDDVPRAFLYGEVISSGLPVAGGPLFVNIGDRRPFQAGKFLQAPLGRAFLGLQFEIDGQMHLGWADVRARLGPVTVFAYAYETDPGKAIAAGAVPEPPSLVLLAAGAAGLAAWRRKRMAPIYRAERLANRSSQHDSLRRDHP